MAVTRNSAKRSSCCASSASASSGNPSDAAVPGGRHQDTSVGGTAPEDSSNGMHHRGAGHRQSKRPALRDRTNNGPSASSIPVNSGCAFAFCASEAQVQVTENDAEGFPTAPCPATGASLQGDPLHGESSLRHNATAGGREVSTSGAAGTAEHFDARGSQCASRERETRLPETTAQRRSSNAVTCASTTLQAAPLAGIVSGPAANQQRPSSKRSGGSLRGVRSKARGASAAKGAGSSGARRRRSEGSVPRNGHPPAASLGMARDSECSLTAASMDCDKVHIGGNDVECELARSLLSNETLQCSTQGDLGDSESAPATRNGCSNMSSSVLCSSAHQNWDSGGCGIMNPGHSLGLTSNSAYMHSVLEGLANETEVSVNGSKVDSSNVGLALVSGKSCSGLTSKEGSAEEVLLFAKEDLGHLCVQVFTSSRDAPVTSDSVPVTRESSVPLCHGTSDTTIGCTSWNVATAPATQGPFSAAPGGHPHSGLQWPATGSVPTGLHSATLQAAVGGDAVSLLTTQERLQGSAVQAAESAMASLQRHAERSLQISSIRQNRNTFLAGEGNAIASGPHLPSIYMEPGISRPLAAGRSESLQHPMGQSVSSLPGQLHHDSQHQMQQSHLLHVVRQPSQEASLLLAPVGQQQVAVLQQEKHTGNYQDGCGEQYLPPEHQDRSQRNQQQHERHEPMVQDQKQQHMPGQQGHDHREQQQQLMLHQLPHNNDLHAMTSMVPVPAERVAAIDETLHMLLCKGVMAKYMDIDNNHADPQLCASYAADIFQHLKAAEQWRRPSQGYMETVQTDINEQMRGILIDWLVEVAEEYKLVADTLYLTCSFIDRYLSTAVVTRGRLQLLGVSCMLIASKYEEIYAPQVDEFCYITDNTYRREEVIEMERAVLKELHFELSYPTIKSFLRRFIRAAQADMTAPSIQLELLGNYFAELTLVDYNSLQFLPSMIAASAVFLSKRTLWPDAHPWTPTLQHYTGYSLKELQECASNLFDLHRNKKGCTLPAIREKYRQAKFQNVASISPLADLPETLFKEDPDCQK